MKSEDEQFDIFAVKIFSCVALSVEELRAHDEICKQLREFLRRINNAAPDSKPSPGDEPNS